MSVCEGPGLVWEPRNKIINIIPWICNEMELKYTHNMLLRPRQKMRGGIGKEKKESERRNRDIY